MAADDDDRVDDEIEESEDTDIEEDEFGDEQGDEVTTDLDEFDEGDGEGDEGEDDIDAVVELSTKEQSARSLEIRRAIEERMEERQFHEDLDYLDLDLEDD